MATPLDLPEPPDAPPAGPNLELDPAFGEMERAAQGKAETQYGNTVEAATPPDWKEAASLATAMLGRTRDLRVMAMLGIASVNLHDLPAYAGVLATVRQHVETMWDRVHPQLDPEDDNDPLLRANALLQLAHVGRVLRPLRDLPLATPPRARAVAWRDIAILNNVIEAEPGRERFTDKGIRGAFAATDPARLAALREACVSIRTDLGAIVTAFDAQTQPGAAPDYTDLTKLIGDIGKEVTRHEAMIAEAAPPPESDESHEAPEAGPDAMAEPNRPARAARSFTSIQSITALGSREEALHALELAASYFRTSEPSSPLPLLIDRAKRLAPMAFLDILRDLAPDGLIQAQVVAGPPAPEG